MSDILSVAVQHKQYRGREVLRDVHLSLKAGELVSLVGASGCGKSTLLRLIAGLDTDRQADVRLQGQRVDGVNPGIGFVFQEPRLMPWLDVSANVAFGADLAQVGPARIAQLIEAVGMTPWATALPKQLSGGQAQRVAIARGLVRQPRVLLLDEPFSAVDAFTRMKLQDMLLRVVREQGVAVLMVTHDLDEAAYLSDRVLVMDRQPGPFIDELCIHEPFPRARDSDVQASARRQLLHRLHAAHAL